ncbi:MULTISPECIES: hypothetical protein [unclassified Bradyrhizobium]|uniref:hypothetical protein n=1 Tax=unclassified Bradyrhizobium TaxID=2631580 RepID=UPI0028E62DCF|nr:MULTISPECIES: hypothetical protein [unclassified Bradyrhizobium]
MRKFVKIAIVVCLSVAAVPAVLFAWIWYKTAQVDSFYQERPLLRAMRAAVQKTGGGDSVPAREALFQMMPLGANKEAAIAVLSKEGLGCQAVTDAWMRQRLSNSPDVSRTSKEWVDCQLETQSVIGYVHWVVDLEFEAEHLSDARVTILYLSL